MSSSGMWRCVDLALTDWRLSLQPPAHAGSPLADSSTLKMEAIRSSETSVNARSTQRHIPEDDILQGSVYFWDMTCSLLKVNRRFGVTYRIYLQSRSITNQREAGSRQTCISSASYLQAFVYCLAYSLTLKKEAKCPSAVLALYPRR
jgi:hypothetical protein